MSRSPKVVSAILRRIDQLPYGRARTAAALKLANEVEADGPRSALPRVYLELVESYTYGDQPDLGFVPFVKVLALYDEEPGLFSSADEHSMLWEYKWMVDNLIEFPNVPAAQIDESLVDLQRRYSIYGEGAEPAAMCAFDWARHRGAPETEEAYQRWITTARDSLSDCAACTAATRAEYLFEVGRLDEGIALVEATLEDDDTCAEQPASITAQLQLAYLDRDHPGDRERAVGAYRRFLSDQAEAKTPLTTAQGYTIEFLARVRQPEAALRHLHRFAKFLLVCESPGERLEFLTHVGAGLRILAEEFNGAAEPVAVAGLTECETVGALWRWVRDEAQRLAHAFDERNGNRHQSGHLVTALRSRPLKAALDLTPPDIVAMLAAPPATKAPRPQEELSSDVVLRQAEELARSKPSAAIEKYLAAGASYSDDGLLEQAGFAYAEAARLLGEFDAFEDADQTYVRAIALLQASETSVIYVVPVVLSRVEVLFTTGHAERALQALDDLRAQLAQAETDLEQAELADELRKRREQQLGAAVAGEMLARARVLIAGGLDARPGAALAIRAAETFAEADDIRLAATAFAEAGKTYRSLGVADQAKYCFESAYEGFTLAAARSERAEVAAALLELFEEAGDDAAADRLASDLAKPI